MYISTINEFTVRPGSYNNLQVNDFDVYNHCNYSDAVDHVGLNKVLSDISFRYNSQQSLCDILNCLKNLHGIDSLDKAMNELRQQNIKEQVEEFLK